MNLTLPDLANIAAIISVPLMLVTWLVTRERFIKFWSKRFKLVLIISLLIGLVGLWRIGWLKWLQHQVTWPVWALILSFVLIAILSGILILKAYTSNGDHSSNSTSFKKLYYEIYGARWHLQGRAFVHPPICAKCSMEMLQIQWPDRLGLQPFETWKCRECSNTIEWNVFDHGNLLQDVTAHYNAEMRRAKES